VSASSLASTGLLCLVVFASTVCVGAFGPLLPEIARAQRLPDWQLGVLAGSFGFARMAADLPAGALASRRLAASLTLAPLTLLAGMLLLSTAGPFPVLVLGRLLTGLAHTLVMVGSLTAVLQEKPGPGASVRLNTLEFSGMLGVLGGLAAVGLLPERWPWDRTLLAAATPVVVALPAALVLARTLPRGLATPPPAARVAAAPRPASLPPIVRLMFALGVVMALAWSAVSQFVIPLRGTREFGLDRAGISGLLSLAQLVDLIVLLPVGWLADRIGRPPVLTAVAVAAAPRRGLRAVRPRDGRMDAAAGRDPRAHRRRAARLADGRLPRRCGRGDLPRPPDLRRARPRPDAPLHRAGGGGRLRDRGEGVAGVGATPHPALSPEGRGK
jgi:MFS family permease